MIKSQNIFGRARSNSRGGESAIKLDAATKEKLDSDFENKSLKLLKVSDWSELDTLATMHLEATKGTSFKGFFYLGVALYKMGEFENAVKAFQRAEEITPDDA